MKGGVSSYQISTKRRWKGFVIAVLGLVILSMLVPLVFLLGFHSHGFPSEQHGSLSHNKTGHIKQIIELLAPPKESVNYPIKETSPVRKESNKSISRNSVQGGQLQGSLGPPAENYVHKLPPPSHKVNISSPVVVIKPANTVDEEMPCELRFGSYCLWRREHKEVMKDSMVKKMKDRLFVARAYFPSIAKLPAHEKLSGELKQNIQDFERILSETTTDADLPSHIGEKLQKMEAVIARSKSIPVDCNNVDKKFRQLVDLTEDEANFHTRQSAFLYQLVVQTMPKSLHCLSMRLTVEYFNKGSSDLEVSMTEKFVDPELYHYVVFSQNIIASSVVINSTVAHAKESKKLVFHVLTDRANYYSMKMWFFRNAFEESAVQVLNIEDYIPESNNKMPDSLLPEEFRVTFSVAHMLSKMQYRTEYISLFSHSHYLLPEILKDLDKIVVLDDDMLVQKDLSALWKINLGKNVNGAIEICSVRLGQLSNYLSRNSMRNNSCAWMSGLNVIDLARWRELNLSGTFRKFFQELGEKGMHHEAVASSDYLGRLGEKGMHHEAVASRASLLTFQDLVHPLDNSWVLSSLGHDYGLSVPAIRKASALHYNGNMKPFLELGIPEYKSFWVKYLNREDPFLSECNVSP